MSASYDTTHVIHCRRLYVSTVDGILTALDTSGQPLWSYSSQEPLFKSTLSYSEVRKMYMYVGHSPQC